MKLLVILIFASGLTGCASFYSNVNHDELSQYEASVWREGNTISMEIKNVAGLNIYELDHRVVGDAVILSAHRISSGGSAKRTFQIEIPEAVRAVFWLNRDGSRLRVTMSPRPPNQRAGVDAGFPVLFVFERVWSGPTQRVRWPTYRYGMVLP